MSNNYTADKGLTSSLGIQMPFQPNTMPSIVEQTPYNGQVINFRFILELRKMFIGGIAPITIDSSLRQYFGTFGEVSDPVIMRDKETNVSRGFGFITFSDPQVFEDVLSMTPHIIDGKQVECKRAMPKESLQIQSQNVPQIQTSNILKKSGGVQNITPVLQKQSSSLVSTANLLQQQQNPITSIQQRYTTENNIETMQNNQQHYRGGVEASKANYQGQNINGQGSYSLHQGQKNEGSRQQNNNSSQSMQNINFDGQFQNMQQTQQQTSIQQNLMKQLQANGNQQNHPPPPTHFEFEGVPVTSTANYANNVGLNQNASQAELSKQQQYTAYINLQGLISNNNQQSELPVPTLHQLETPNNNHNQSQHFNGGQQEISKVVSQQHSMQTLDSQFRKIFVGGLPHNLQDEEFKAYFIKYGEIEDCAILRDKRTGKPRGFGFVTYRDLETVEHVMDLKDNHTIQGKWVDCKRAVPAGQIVKEIEKKALVSSTPATQSSIPKITQSVVGANSSSGSQINSQASQISGQIGPLVQSTQNLQQFGGVVSQQLSSQTSVEQFLPQAQQILAGVLAGQIDPKLIQEAVSQQVAAGLFRGSGLYLQGAQPQQQANPSQQIATANVQVFVNDQSSFQKNNNQRSPQITINQDDLNRQQQQQFTANSQPFFRPGTQPGLSYPNHQMNGGYQNHQQFNGGGGSSYLNQQNGLMSQPSNHYNPTYSNQTPFLAQGGNGMPSQQNQYIYSQNSQNLLNNQQQTNFYQGGGVNTQQFNQSLNNNQTFQNNQFTQGHLPSFQNTPHQSNLSMPHNANQGVGQITVPGLSGPPIQSPQSQEPAAFQSGYPYSQTFKQQQLQIQQQQQHHLIQLTQAAKAAGIPFDQILAHIQQTYQISEPMIINPGVNNPFSTNNANGPNAPSHQTVQRVVTQGSSGSPNMQPQIQHNSAEKVQDKAENDAPMIQKREKAQPLFVVESEESLVVSAVNSNIFTSKDKLQQEQTEMHIHHLNAMYSKFSLEDMEKQDSSQRIKDQIPQSLASEDFKNQRPSKTSQPTPHVTLPSSSKVLHQGIPNEIGETKNSGTSAAVARGLPQISMQSMNPLQKSDNKLKKEASMIQNINDDIKNLERSNFDLENHSRVTSRKDETSSAERVGVSGFYTQLNGQQHQLQHQQEQVSNKKTINESVLQVKSEQPSQSQGFKWKNEEEVNTRKEEQKQSRTSQEAINQQWVLNQKDKKGTFKFTQDEEYDKRYQVGRQNKNGQSGDNQYDQRNQNRIDLSPNDIADSMSGGGDSIKEPQEELALFAANDPEKEHNSCPQMHLKSIHSVNYLPSLKRVESAGNIAEESDEEVQAVRGRHIIGSGKNLLQFKSKGDIGSNPGSRQGSDKDSAGSHNKNYALPSTPGISGFAPQAQRKPEFGQIRSETYQGQSGPSKRADRQYKPF